MSNSEIEVQCGDSRCVCADWDEATIAKVRAAQAYDPDDPSSR